MRLRRRPLSHAVRAHCIGHWGEPSREAEFRREGEHVHVLKWAAPDGVARYATLGASDKPARHVGPGHRVEYVLELRPERDDVASAFANLATHRVYAGSTASYEDPLWPATAMRTFVVVAAPDLLPTLPPVRGVHVEFLRAIPLHDAERAFVVEHGAAELRRRWDAAGVAYRDAERAPFVG
jgi:hypothetical protein